MAERRVIINADDFGLTEGVTRGIIEAHMAGAVSAASMFANTPGVPHAVAAAHEHPRLDLGLHFNLTAGLPLSPPGAVASLCDAEGRFLSLGALWRRSFSGGVQTRHVVRECEAQLDRLRASGVSLTHIDGHRHVHVLPGVWAGVVAVARVARIPVVRVPREPLIGGRAVAKLAIAFAWRVANRESASTRAPHFRGVGLLGAPTFVDRLIGTLDRLPPGVTEVMVHPGYVDADLLRWDSYSRDRERELVALRSPQVLARLTLGDPELVRFVDL